MRIERKDVTRQHTLSRYEPEVFDYPRALIHPDYCELPVNLSAKKTTLTIKPRTIKLYDELLLSVPSADNKKRSFYGMTPELGRDTPEDGLLGSAERPTGLEELVKLAEVDPLVEQAGLPAMMAKASRPRGSSTCTSNAQCRACCNRDTGTCGRCKANSCQKVQDCYQARGKEVCCVEEQCKPCVTPTASPTATSTATATPSPAVAKVLSPTSTATPTATGTATPTATASASATRTSTATATPANATVTPTRTPAATATATPATTRASTPTATRTPTSTNTPFAPTVTPTRTPTTAATATATRTATPTSTATRTVTATPSPTATYTATATATRTVASTATRTATPTSTPTATATRTSTATPLPMPTFTATATSTPTATRTATPTSTGAPVVSVAPPTYTPAATASPTPDSGSDSSEGDCPGTRERLANFKNVPGTSNVASVVAWVLKTNDNDCQPFLVLDKQCGEIYAFDKDGQLIHSAHALVGRSLGDKLSWTDRKLGSWVETDRNQTPAGCFPLTVYESPHYGPAIEWWSSGNWNWAIHKVPTDCDNKEERKAAIAAPNPSCNPRLRTLSSACINVNLSDINNFIGSFPTKGSKMYIMPVSEEGKKFSPAFANINISAPAAPPGELAAN